MSQVNELTDVVHLPCSYGGESLSGILHRSTAAYSLSEARRLIAQGAVRVNGIKFIEPKVIFYPGFQAVIRIGKTQQVNVVLEAKGGIPVQKTHDDMLEELHDDDVLEEHEEDSIQFILGELEMNLRKDKSGNANLSLSTGQGEVDKIFIPEKLLKQFGDALDLASKTLHVWRKRTE